MLMGAGPAGQGGTKGIYLSMSGTNIWLQSFYDGAANILVRRTWGDPQNGVYPIPNDDDWHHIVITTDANPQPVDFDARLYVDGQPQQKTSDGDHKSNITSQDASNLGDIETIRIGNSGNLGFIVQTCSF